MKKLKDLVKIEIEPEDLFDLLFYARRYCDGRSTYAPSQFNDIYLRIRLNNPDFIRAHDHFDETLIEKGKYWPFAKDGMYNEETGCFDARKECQI